MVGDGTLRGTGRIALREEDLGVRSKGEIAAEHGREEKGEKKPRIVVSWW